MSLHLPTLLGMAASGTASSTLAPRVFEEGLPKPRRYVAIAAISFGTALLVIDGSTAIVALPTIAEDLQINKTSAVQVVSVYQLVLVAMLLPLSRLGDRLGHRRLYQAGQIVFILASIFCLFANSFPYLLFARGLQALGAAAVLSVSTALLRQIYPSRHLGRGLGINIIVVSSAAVFAPTMGGLLLLAVDWRWIFAAAAPFAILSLLLGQALPDPQPRRERMDLLGSFLCVLTLALVIGALDVALHGNSFALAAALLVAGIGVGIGFVRRELSEESPVVPVDLLADRVFALSMVAAFAAFISEMILFLTMPFRLHYENGYSPADIGLVMAAWPAAMIFVAPLAGVLSDRISAPLLGTIGMAGASAGFIALSFLPPEPSQFDVIWRFALCGAGFGMFLSPNSRLILGSAPPERSASAGGMIATTRLGGQTIGATLAGALLATGFGAGSLPALVCAGGAVIAGLCSLTRLCGKTASNRTLDAVEE